MKIFRKTIDSPIGKIFLEASEITLLKLQFNPANILNDDSNFIIEQTKYELEQYFSGKREKFTIPIKLIGTDFQIKAWKILQTIPYGSTISYQEEAILIGNKNKARAVGQANSRNPIPIIVPCHRVIAKNGSLGGFRDDIEIKKFLLYLEHAAVKSSLKLRKKFGLLIEKPHPNLLSR